MKLCKIRAENCANLSILLHDLTRLTFFCKNITWFCKFNIWSWPGLKEKDERVKITPEFVIDLIQTKISEKVAASCFSLLKN